MSEYLCPKCGSELEGFVEGSCMGSRCKSCGWSIVATYIPPIRNDWQDYTISLLPGCDPVKSSLKAIARIAMTNFIGAKRMMFDAPVTLFTGKAPEVLARKLTLEQAGVPIAISPQFPYDDEGELREKHPPS